MDGINVLRKTGCCPRCVLVHSGVKDAEHYTSSAAVTAATAALADGTLSGLLGEQNPTDASCYETNGTDGANSLASNDIAKHSSCFPSIDSKLLDVHTSYSEPVCVSCLGLLQDVCCSKETIEKVRVQFLEIKMHHLALLTLKKNSFFL